MKVPCTKTLYWHQEPGYSGMLTGDPMFGDKEGVPVLICGKEYEIIPVPTREGLEHITLYAIGEDGYGYSIMEDGVHYQTTRMALDHFAFNRLKIKIHDCRE